MFDYWKKKKTPQSEAPAKSKSDPVPSAAPAPESSGEWWRSWTIPDLSDITVQLIRNDGKEFTARIRFDKNRVGAYISGCSHDVGEWYDHLDVMWDIDRLVSLRDSVEMGFESDAWREIVGVVDEINGKTIYQRGCGDSRDNAKAVILEYL